MPERLPISALLSQALVAFTLECDNAFEARVPHRTSTHTSTPGAPWLVSLAMWLVYLQHIPEQGIAFSALQQALGMRSSALQMWMIRLGRWWGYLALPKPASGNKQAPIPADTILRFTVGGLVAARAWQELVPQITERWRARFGADAVEALGRALRTIAAAPESQAAFLAMMEGAQAGKYVARAAAELTLPELLAKVLAVFAVGFSAQSGVPLPVCANLLRVVPDGTARVRDLAQATGLAKEGVATVLRMATRQGVARLVSDPASRVRAVVITEKGLLAAESYEDAARRVERAWQKRFGTEPVGQLRDSLERIALGAKGKPSPLLAGVTPHPDGWRAKQPRREVLPHFPMISHRGGYPDGA